MYCAAITSKGTPCKRGIKTGHSVYLGGYVYHLCGISHHADGYGKLNPARRTKYSTTAVIASPEEGIMHVNMSNTCRDGGPHGEITADGCIRCGHMPNIEQPSLFKEEESTVDELRAKINAIQAKAVKKANPDQITIFVRRMINELPTKIQVENRGKQWTGTLEGFKDLAAEILAHEENSQVKGFAFRWKNQNYIVTRDKQVITTKMIVPVQMEYRRTR